MNQFAPWRTVTFHAGAPWRPRFVMMWITPFDASVPYSVAAAGPLMTSMLSMSSGLKSLSREMTLEPKACTSGPVACALSTRTPSTYSSGWFDSEKLLEPRIRTCEPEPTMPVPGVTTRPGALAFSRLCTLATCASSTVSAARTWVTELPIARRCVPPAVPVTTS